MRMTLSEALCDDLTALETGTCFLLPRLDVSGRQVLYLDPSRNTREGYTSDSLVSIEGYVSNDSLRCKSHDTTEQLRAIWYVVEVASQENTDVSSNIVQVVWMKHMTILDYDKIYDRITYFETSAWPLRRCSNHVCCPESYTIRILKPILFAVSDKENRARTLFHAVPESKLFSVLSEYGILQDMMPTAMGGSLQFDHSEWIENRRATELEEISLL